MTESSAFITNDAVVLGILMSILAAVFYTASSSIPFWQKFYKYVPVILLCYFIPSILNSAGLISGEDSNLYFMASRYLLPASLVLLTLSTDFKGIVNLGPKAIIMFLAGTFGIVLGGPITILIFSVIAPDVVGGVGPDAVWRGLTTVAGSWIGGGANQAAMKEVFEVGDTVFSGMVAVDVIVANIWMAFLLYGAGISDSLDVKLKADNSAIKSLQKSLEHFHEKTLKIPKVDDTFVVLGVAFAATAVSHFFADIIGPWFGNYEAFLTRFNLQSLSSRFFWMIVMATTIGLIISFTPMRKLEGVGASRIGSVFIFVLVATIGMKMNVLAIVENPGLFFVGLVWMLFHVIFLLTTAKIIKAPFFFVAVGSQANVGGAASAPVVAAAFSPSLAPVGVLLAVLGYSLGTYGAYLCGLLMQAAAP
jgi:uncharacterized membrane protein